VAQNKKKTLSKKGENCRLIAQSHTKWCTSVWKDFRGASHQKEMKIMILISVIH
jgi:hypothetical protein